MKYDFTPIMDAASVSEQSQTTVIRLLVQALDQLERRVRDLEDDYDNAKPKGDDEAQPFEERVLEVLAVRSGSAREALDFEDNVLRAIEDNSYTTFTHLEAEIDEKLDQMTQSYGFAEAVEEAVKGSIVSTVEDVISELGVIDPEEIVRQGLKAII